MDIEEVAGDAWETAARREAAVRRLIALPDRERTRKAFAFEARRLGLSVAARCWWMCRPMAPPVTGISPWRPRSA